MQPIPPREEIIDHLYDKHLSNFEDEVVCVRYSTDRSKRFIILHSRRGFYKLAFEVIEIFSEEEWSYFCNDADAYPAFWVERSHGLTSLYSSVDEALRDLETLSEYQLYFISSTRDEPPANKPSNKKIMRDALNRNTIALLRQKGFTGTYPHFRRKREDCIELIMFMTNKWGGSFTVEVSAAFPNSENTNYTLYGKMTEDTLRVDATNSRYRVPGMYDGWFYYQDVYRKRPLFLGNVYHSVSEKEAAGFVPPRGYRLIQKFNADTADAICKEVNRQLEKAFSWLETFERKHS